MNKGEILKMAFDSILDADQNKAEKALIEGENIGIPPLEMLSEGFSPGMKELGDQFGNGEVFLPELMFSTEVMKFATQEIENKMEPGTTSKKAVMVIGTVAGDVHDIGKGIVASLVKINGIEVHDLGREVPAEVFVEKVIEYKADFVGSSALLTTTMTEQRRIEELLVVAGIRDKVKTLVGGAPVTQRWAEKIGADAYCEDASETVNYILSCLE